MREAILRKGKITRWTSEAGKRRVSQNCIAIERRMRMRAIKGGREETNLTQTLPSIKIPNPTKRGR